jgi:hypothetical protein
MKSRPVRRLSAFLLLITQVLPYRSDGYASEADQLTARIRKDANGAPP